MELKAGIKNQKELTVNESNVAAVVGSGALAVFATPAMVALMEMTAAESVAPALPEGYTSVGTALDITHLAASPLDAHIRCESELTEVDGRRLVFSVKAFDDVGLIGEGTHERYTVEIKRFMDKAAGRLQGAE